MTMTVAAPSQNSPLATNGLATPTPRSLYLVWGPVGLHQLSKAFTEASGIVVGL